MSCISTQHTIFLLSLLGALIAHLLLVVLLDKYLAVNFFAQSFTATHFTETKKQPLVINFNVAAHQIDKSSAEEVSPALVKEALAEVNKSAKAKPAITNQQTAANPQAETAFTDTSAAQAPIKSSSLASRALARAATSGLADISASQQIRRITPASQLSVEENFYLQTWQAKVERVGRLNYPAELAKQNLSGKLRLATLINSDGSLAKVEVIQSSGNPLLDAAAIKILHLAAPFAPLPAAIQQTAKQLEITRTWRLGQGLSVN